ncbi:biotin/lipoyl-containing protein, partial [Thermaurantiacus sp.]
MAMDVVIPALGESVTEASVGQWLKAVGEPVAADEPIVSLETDKVAVEVPAPVAGILTEQLAREGDTVEVGALIARIEPGPATAANAPAPAEAATPEAPPAPPTP